MSVVKLPTAPSHPTAPRLYADLLAELERRRRLADKLVVRSMAPPRPHV